MFALFVAVVFCIAKRMVPRNHIWSDVYKLDKSNKVLCVISFFPIQIMLRCVSLRIILYGGQREDVWNDNTFTRCAF